MIRMRKKLLGDTKDHHKDRDPRGSTVRRSSAVRHLLEESAEEQPEQSDQQPKRASTDNPAELKVCAVYWLLPLLLYLNGQGQG